MKQILSLLGMTAATVILATSAHAADCVSGAAVGAVAGHVAHHHAVAGAAAGCLVGHEMNKHEKKKAAEANGQ